MECLHSLCCNLWPFRNGRLSSKLLACPCKRILPHLSLNGQKTAMSSVCPARLLKRCVPFFAGVRALSRRSSPSSFEQRNHSMSLTYLSSLIVPSYCKSMSAANHQHIPSSRAAPLQRFQTPHPTTPAPRTPKDHQSPYVTLRAQTYP